MGLLRPGAEHPLALRERRVAGLERGWSRVGPSWLYNTQFCVCLWLGWVHFVVFSLICWFFVWISMGQPNIRVATKDSTHMVKLLT